MTRRQLIGPGVIAIVLVSVLAFVAARPPGSEPTAEPGATDASMTTAPTGTPRPIPKHEVYGYLPYWEMDETIADHVNETELTTLGLFSVTNQRDGSLDTSQRGYKAITGDLGARLIKDAHERGTRVELVFTSFGNPRNARLFGSDELQDATIDSLVTLASDLGVDGINVDVEQLGLAFIPAYAAFVSRLRIAAVSANADAQVSVATTAGRTGAAMAAAAADAGADRIFIMGYDYRTSGSAPGATSPLDRRDGEQDLVWSLDLYEALGVPVERMILGLPLYGVTWPVAGPALGEVQVGRGDAWFPNEHLDLLASPPVPPEVDPVEIVEFYAIPPADGSTPDPSDGAPADGWRAIYVDSAATLTPKLALADQRGLAGAGFWAIGFERGQPDLTALIARFRAGELD